MNLAYVRVSTQEQNAERQKEALRPYAIDKWYEDKVSGKDMDRPQLRKLLDYCREGDTIIVHDLSRLARSTKDLLSIVDLLKEKNVALVSLKEKVDSSTATGKLMLTMVGAINEFERAVLLERQAEGIAIAKREGKYKGRRRVEVSNFSELYERYRVREVTKSKLAKEIGVSRPTLDRLIDDMEKTGRGKKNGLENGPL